MPTTPPDEAPHEGEGKASSVRSGLLMKNVEGSFGEVGFSSESMAVSGCSVRGRADYLGVGCCHTSRAVKGQGLPRHGGAAQSGTVFGDEDVGVPGGGQGVLYSV